MSLTTRGVLHGRHSMEEDELNYDVSHEVFRFLVADFLTILSYAEGDHIKVTASPYPFPTVCADKQSTDWFGSIQRTLKWNERQRQKSFVILVRLPDTHFLR